ncbi:WD40 repeat-like protein [Cryphonectria parasitica EP155]|uniref:WD40 repeat-like protein n=1 Tax=Cryphonectria parasitica (strain ATCC 38755 / EP155) TaxID=660469 RepID=A0A9P4Y8A3_CRYP1|nr:WD40 repeat-like protein [Cryphonectria parasitica EP155]KAF3768787.1 WD40 repeat-like protein [Cryphonectria parasitica EP155]
MSSNNPHHDPATGDEEQDMVDLDEVAEEIAAENEDGDIDMSDPEDDEHEEVQLVNDSVAYFDTHKDSIFAIAQHPTNPNIIATGGSEGDADDAPGKGYVLVIPQELDQRDDGPVLPPSYAADPSAAARELASQKENIQIQPVFSIDGHTDSINALAFTLPNGDFLVSGGLDGRLRAYKVDASKPSFTFLGESQEVPEINWLAPCPNTDYPNSVALGASDGSVWVYTIDPSDTATPLQIVQTYFLHTTSCTAGAWTSDGSLLATVDEDSSLYVWDVWGLAAAKGLAGDNGQTVVSLTGQDQRFEVEGGLYSVAIEPRGGYLAVGGAGGAIRIVGLPRITDQTAGSAPQAGSKAGKAKGKAAGGKAAGGEAQAGQILASLEVQSDSIESLSFAPASAPIPLLAAGSVDGSISVFDPSRQFNLRRNIQGAHEEFSVVKLEWVKQPQGTGSGAAAQQQWLLTSCGMDGVVRRWNLQGATPSQHAPNAAVAGLEKEWRGHRGDGEGGGVLGFVQGNDGKRIVTAGDDGLALVFQV